jgi:hypothetical protein
MISGATWPVIGSASPPALIEQTQARFATACADWPARIEASFLSAEMKTRYLTLLTQRRERLGGV